MTSRFKPQSAVGPGNDNSLSCELLRRIWGPIKQMTVEELQKVDHLIETIRFASDLSK